MRLILILFLFLFLRGYTTAQLYTFKNFGHKEGLSMATVSSIFQSKNGEIWLGMDGSGLVRFNGYTFQEVFHENQDNDHHVTSILEHKKTLYFTSRYKGLYTYKDGKYKKIVNSNRETGDILKIISLDSVKLLITGTGIYSLKNDLPKKIHSFTSTEENLIIKNVIELKNNCILLSSLGNFHFSSKLNRIIPLNNWLHVSKETTSFIEFAYFDGELIQFYDRYLTKKLKVVLNAREEIYDLDFYNIESPIGNQHVISLSGNKKSKSGIFITSSNELYKTTSMGFKKIAHNYDQQLERCEEVLIDQNGDYWIISSLKGLYKVSLEPFTNVLLHPVYKSGTIKTVFKSSVGEVLVSTMDGVTNIGKLYELNAQFKEHNFVTNAIVEYKNQLYLGTNEGIKIYNSGSGEIKSFVALSNEKITFLFLDKDVLWVGIAKKGLARILLNTPERKIEYPNQNTIPGYFYTAQHSSDKDKIYFGSNNGIVVYDKKSKKFFPLKTSSNIGDYIGVSIKDVYGNIWFTGDNAILGILANNKQVVLDDRTIFPSTLFYTLNSDQFGNLIVGTNKGITIVKLNSQGIVLNYRTFSGKSGFEGYETNMRAQYQEGNSIFVGTIEGLYLINTEILNSLPPPTRPVIQIKENELNNNIENSVQFQFSVNNPKIKKIVYSYRIIGYQEDWSTFTTENYLFLSDLPNGNFTLEVRATNDMIHFSPIASHTFNIHLPFWKSKWFIFMILIGIILLNLYLINRNKSFSSGNLFNTKDTSVTIRLTPQILFFGFISNTSVHLIGPFVDPTIQSNLAATLFSGCIILGLYLAALNAKNTQKIEQYRFLLISGFIIIILHNEFGVFISNLHPFFVLSVVVINTLSSIILEKIKSVIVFSLIFILINSFIVLLIDNSFYNKTLFMFAIIISAFISVISTYLRYDSLEKLIFISGLINKGNVLVIAFNSKGVMTYVSENVSDSLNTNHDKLIGKPISYLNTFVPDDGFSRKVDLTNDFEDGKKYLVPMLNIQNDLCWMEWSCKVFTEDVKVILGQNVTDRLELENTYELLVQNAEDLIYQCDTNGFFRFLNDRCYAKLGYSKPELIGKHSLSIVSENYATSVSDFYRKHFENRLESSYFEFPIETKNGEIIWIGQYVTTLYKPGNKKIITGFLALARDITITRKQQEIIKEQRDDITSSINYAKKIQLNLLPSEDKFSTSFIESCVLYKPKDIVSGDFYWLEQFDELTVIALGDCTGHGVPGSFMTLLGINLLNTLILEQRIVNPGVILDELDKRLSTILPREYGDENMNDGMEISICVFNHNTFELAYSCAGSRFLIYDTNSFTMYKGDTKHIGDKPIPDFKNYITHYTKFNPGSTMYLFTDGFQDQFGGTKNKKYSFRRMLELFEANIRLPLAEQQHMIDDEFEKWRSEFIQTDDVTIIALRNLTKIT